MHRCIAANAASDSGTAFGGSGDDGDGGGGCGGGGGGGVGGVDSVNVAEHASEYAHTTCEAAQS